MGALSQVSPFRTLLRREFCRDEIIYVYWSLFL